MNLREKQERMAQKNRREKEKKTEARLVKMKKHFEHKAAKTASRPKPAVPAIINLPSQEISSAKTALLSYMPALFNKVKFASGSMNLDLGAGRTEEPGKFLRSKSVRNFNYDPYNKSAAENEKTLHMIKSGVFDTVTCSNVLNVIKEAEARAFVIRLAAHALHDRGFAYFTCWSGDSSEEGRETCNGFQLNQPLKFYLDEIRQVFPGAEIVNGVIRGPKKAVDYLHAPLDLLLWRPTLPIVEEGALTSKAKEELTAIGTPMLYTIEHIYTSEEAATRAQERKEVEERARLRELQALAS